MKKLIFTVLFSYAFLAQAQPNHLVISQVYGAGGNTGALYKNDFVELYNPTGNAISLSGWSLQYAGGTTSNWSSNTVALSGSVAPGKYFLIQLASSGANSAGIALPQPDLASSNITMSATDGKVALVNNTTTLSGTCPLPNAAIVDFVGYGNAVCHEGAAAASGIVSGNTTSSFNRLNNGCTDADNNSSDFAVATVSPRNSTSNGHTCNGTSISVTSVTTTPFCVDAATGTSGTVAYSATGTFSSSTFKAVLSDMNGSFGFSTVIGSAVVSGTNPSGSIAISIPANAASGTGYRIRVEATNPPLTGSQSTAFEIINGAKNLLSNEFSSVGNNSTITLNWTNPTGCYDEIMIVAKEGSSVTGTPTGDGSAYAADLNFLGSGTAFDGGKVVYKGTTGGQTVTSLTNGTIYFFKAFTRRGSNWSSGTEISDHPRVVPLPGEIVINQMSPQYSSSKSDEYIELVNLTDKSFELPDVAIHQADATGVSGVAGGALSGIIQPHSFWLLATGTSNTITVGLTNALLRDSKMDPGFLATNNQVGLVRTTDNTLLDALGYGSISSPVYTEGAATANPSSQSGLKRKTSGADNNNNSADFTAVAKANIELRNSTSRLANAGASIAAGNYTTLEVTGNSTLTGAITVTNKVVLSSGVFTLSDNNLTTAAITDGTNANYIKTSGSGTLSMTNITTDVTFPVGNSTYNPVTISNGNGLNWSVNVRDAVAANAAFSRQYAVQRTWDITPASTPLSGATVVFEYNDNDASQVGSSFDKTKQVQIWSYHNGIWQPVTGPLTPVATASGRKAVTLSNYTRFSPFVIVNINAPLPVHFTGFSARTKDGGVQLQFTNVAEEKVQHYAIERAGTNQLFQTLILLPPQKNNGSVVTYRWFDATPPAGDIWYRIKGLDEDGTVRFTPVLKLNVQHANEGLAVYPNPVQGRTVIWQATLPRGTYGLKVYNSAGLPVLQQAWEHSGGAYSATLVLPAHLPSGVYNLHVGNSAGTWHYLFVVL